ncbi:hypothetical protein H0X09_03415 [Candidatus Saccharibacteria bacterium]|nr:hypothetical protein [Candidatus Saccharibacteria bacterium]
MNMPIEERRQIENEMIFRRANEKVGDDLGAIDAMHVEDNNLHLIRDDDLVLHFKCECSDENCSSRIPIKLSEYQTIHSNRDTFIVLPNHQFDSIEKVLQTKREFSVVKKNKSTSEPGNKLNTTTVTNI